MAHQYWVEIIMIWFFTGWLLFLRRSKIVRKWQCEQFSSLWNIWSRLLVQWWRLTWNHIKIYPIELRKYMKYYARKLIEWKAQWKINEIQFTAFSESWNASMWCKSTSKDGASDFSIFFLGTNPMDELIRMILCWSKNKLISLLNRMKIEQKFAKEKLNVVLIEMT